MQKLSFLKSTYKQGILLGLGFCLYTILMWLTKLDTTYLEYGQYLDIAIILLPIFMIFWAIAQEIKKYKVTLIQRIGIAIFVSAISFLIYNPFLYVYHHYINPEWYDAVLNLNEMKLNANNVPKAEIADTLQKMKDSDIAKAPLFGLSALIPSVIILPTIIGLLSSLFIKNRRQI